MSLLERSPAESKPEPRAPASGSGELSERGVRRGSGGLEEPDGAGRGPGALPKPEDAGPGSPELSESGPEADTAMQLNPFDESLALRILREAAEDYASRHGWPGSPQYREAWFRFRQHVKSLDDLHRMRAKASRTSAKR